ncbi:MAG: hypothetical protein J1E98_13655, partial [Lachnospiraceae bacterium]|nr:hypothetical protein [Lachnospiraceae bacterium]
DDIALEESGLDDIALEESGLDDIALEESGLDDIALEEPGLDDLSLDDMLLEEGEYEETETDTLSLDGIENGEVENENDLAEIDDLLGQSEQSEDIDDEMLALLESVSDSENDDILESGEEKFDFLADGDNESDDERPDLNELMEEMDQEQEASPEEDKKSKKEKKRRKKKSKGEDGELQDNDAKNGDSEGETEKKPGVIARFLAFLTESEEDDETEETAGDTSEDGEASDENKELLNELSEEDKKKKDKKEKKEKKKKKGKKAAADGEEGEEGESKGKKKKPKKEKKVKPVDEEVLNEPPSKKLSKKKVIPVILFCATITAVIIVLSSILPTYLQKRDAHVAFDMGNYAEAYDLLYGKDLSEDDELIMQKSRLILSMNRRLSSYQNYMKMGDNELEALDALVQGVALYYAILPEAEQYNVTGEVRQVYENILALLSERYGLSETAVIEIIAYDDITYTQKLTSLVYGISFDNGTETGEQPVTIEDILPEEQEIIDGLPENVEPANN